MSNSISRFMGSLLKITPPPAKPGPTTAGAGADALPPAIAQTAPVAPSPQLTIAPDSRVSQGARPFAELAVDQLDSMGDLNLPGADLSDPGDESLTVTNSDPNASADPDGTSSLKTPVTPKDPESLRKAADKVFFKADPPITGTNYRKIEADALDVNAKTPKTDAIAAKQVNAGLKFEATVVAKFSKEDQAAYKEVVAQLKGNPKGRLALQVLAAEGTLTNPACKASDGASVLSILQKTASAPLAAGLDRKEVLGDIVQELAVPSAIDQQSKGTCTAAVIQTKLAIEKPAEYARLMAGLASPDGTIAMANGEALVREPGTESPDGSARSATARLFQAAIMEYANGRFDYDNATDSNAGTGGGLSITEVSKAIGAVEGVQEDVRTIDLMKAITSEVAAGRSVPVGMSWQIKGPDGKVNLNHEVLVTDISAGRVYFDNPWGQKESMTLGNFTKRVNSATIAHDSASVPPVDPEADPYLVENRDMVVSNLEGLLGSYADAQAGIATQTDASARDFATYLDQGGGVIGDLRDQLKAMKLPEAPTPETQEAYMGFLNNLNNLAISMASGGTGAATAGDIQKAFAQIDALPN